MSTTHVDEVRERLLNGQKISPTDLAKAKAADEFAELETEAQRIHTEREEQARLTTAVRAFDTEARALLDARLADLRAAYAEHVEAGLRLRALLGEYDQERVRLARRRDAEGLRGHVMRLDALNRSWILSAVEEEFRPGGTSKVHPLNSEAAER